MTATTSGSTGVSPVRPPAPRPAADAWTSSTTAPVLDVVVPVHNEQVDLEPCVRRLHAHVAGFPFRTRITVADNASTDATPQVAAALAAELPDVRHVRLEEKGRGRA